MQLGNGMYGCSGGWRTGHKEVRRQRVGRVQRTIRQSCYGLGAFMVYRDLLAGRACAIMARGLCTPPDCDGLIPAFEGWLPIFMLSGVGNGA
jgi:hypothetical protein